MTEGFALFDAAIGEAADMNTFGGLLVNICKGVGAESRPARSARLPSGIG